jgi:hypothetical protein
MTSSATLPSSARVGPGMPVCTNSSVEGGSERRSRKPLSNLLLRGTPERPWLAITMRSAGHSFAFWTIVAREPGFSVNLFVTLNITTARNMLVHKYGTYE